jgi:hypothetical protein
MITDPAGSFESALAAALRVAGLVVGYWLAASSLAYLLARLARFPMALKATRWMTWRPIRKLVDGLVTGVLSASLALPVAAGTTALGYVPVPAGDRAPAPPTTEAVILPIPIDESEAQPATVNSIYLPIEVGRAEGKRTIDPQAIEVVVRDGDNMWELAETRISASLGKPATDAEIAPYWLAVIGANLSRIRSGDPDLIFPGEVLVLPPLER